MVLLPLLVGWLLYRLFRHAYGPLDAFRRGAVVWGGTMLAMTALLCAVHALEPAGASVGWALICASGSPRRTGPVRPERRWAGRCFARVWPHCAGSDAGIGACRPRPHFRPGH